MNTLQVANGTLHYAVYGTGPPVLLLHGGGLDGRMWDPQVPELAQTHCVVVPDARGHGHSSTPFAPFRHCDDVAVLIRHLDAGPAILIGLSMGAGTALDTALEHPDLVRGVVVVGAGTSEPDFEDPWVLDLLDTWRRTAAAGDAEGWIEAFMLFAAGPKRRLEDMDDDVVRHLRQMVTRTVANHVRPDAAAPEAVPDSWSRLAEIQVPVLALSGALDTPDNIRMAARAADSVTDGRTALIRGAAHYPNLEQPAAFNAELQAFLGSIPLRPV
ncbi:alpha/beta fold hydrolase [Arthrobacter castelli]|uniref:alpha/beta fold hydrolase n=1 Tax=Arthrobacter castelli TaxID=271431 RepID=UPI0003FD7E55|nr:alpha/beta fold hydrolase [Arthrobacter castelli]